MDPIQISTDILHTMERAWEAGDGRQFGQVLTDDADLVDTRGNLRQGREEISAAYQATFDLVYKDSRINYQLIGSQVINAGTILTHAVGVLDVPTGRLAGTHHATIALVILNDGDRWLVRSMQNTLVVKN